ncbi:MAG TPA: Uma2 family endonuclease [Blastocatellia bacterium]|nr:Uma2 family endonuclease [Blastocatellia bacterium]
MSQALPLKKIDLTPIVKQLVTEDDEPVDNLFTEKQQRLLTEPLYSSWTPQPDEDHPDVKRPFLAAANVGVFFSVHQLPLVPDMFLSLDIEVGKDWNADETRSYFVWELGKVPEAVVEIVSNKEGNELTSKMKRYAEWGILYYVVFDPFHELSETTLCVYELGFGKRLRPRKDFLLPTLGLSLTLWEGEYEGVRDTWLRWCDQDGRIIPTGKEARDLEAARADNAEAEVERLRAELAQLTARRRSKK